MVYYGIDIFEEFAVLPAIQNSLDPILKIITNDFFFFRYGSYLGESSHLRVGLKLQYDDQALIDDIFKAYKTKTINPPRYDPPIEPTKGKDGDYFDGIFDYELCFIGRELMDDFQKKRIDLFTMGGDRIAQIIPYIKDFIKIRLRMLNPKDEVITYWRFDRIIHYYFSPIGVDSNSESLWRREYFYAFLDQLHL